MTTQKNSDYILGGTDQTSGSSFADVLYNISFTEFVVYMHFINNIHYY